MKNPKKLSKHARRLLGELIDAIAKEAESSYTKVKDTHPDDRHTRECNIEPEVIYTAITTVMTDDSGGFELGRELLYECIRERVQKDGYGFEGY